MPLPSLTRYFACLLLACMTAGAAFAQSTEGPEFTIEPASVTREVRESRAPRISDFSGLPVPRFASLKYEEVNGRAGPGTDYPIKWVYRRQGLPVMVVRESRDWAKIRDPQGDEVWVHQRLLAARRTGITASRMAISRRPESGAPLVAEVDMGVVIDIADCSGDWCRALIDDVRGWAPRVSIWGAADID